MFWSNLRAEQIGQVVTVDPIAILSPEAASVRAMPTRCPATDWRLYGWRAIRSSTRTSSAIGLFQSDGSDQIRLACKAQPQAAGGGARPTADRRRH